MSDRRKPISEYRAMWMIAMFDLPVDTKAQRRAYTIFRKSLLKQGFMMLQYSVYARFCPSEEHGERYRRRIRSELPREGEVRIMGLTDHQFSKMDVFHGAKPSHVESAPVQLYLF